MNIGNIKRIGYFDNIAISGYCEPFCKNSRLTIDNDDSFEYCTKLKYGNEACHIRHLHIDIFGESSTNDIEAIENAKRMNLKSVRLENVIRYKLGYTDIIVISNSEDKNKLKESVTSIFDKEEIKNICDVAIRIIQINEVKLKIKNIAIIDRIYIESKFRKNGLSSWIHSNLRDIIRVYAEKDVQAALLTYGDFSNESMRFFGVDAEQYKKNLRAMYKDLGYKGIGLQRYLMNGLQVDDILLKIFD